ncbi:MAG: HEAT repeat domain-containing protein, partial [Acidobacteriota bacterium]
MKLKLIFFFVFFIAGVGNVFAQDLDFYAEQIKNSTTESKRSALFQLRNLQTAEASRIALPALQDTDEIVRATAIYSVIYLPSDEITQALLPLLQDTSSLVRKETAYALGKTKNQQAIQTLLNILEREKDLEVKSAYIVALGEIGESFAIDSLVKILQKKPKEEDDFLRRATARSIGQIAQVQQVNS